MGEHLTDQELRHRLSVFNTVVPPVTNSTRGLLLKKLAKLEHDANVQMNQVGSSVKDNSSLLNVSNWNNSASEDEDQNSYLLPGYYIIAMHFVSNNILIS
jgi:membrane protein Man1